MYYKNFEPRIGFAYAPSYLNHKTVFSASYSVLNAPILQWQQIYGGLPAGYSNISQINNTPNGFAVGELLDSGSLATPFNLHPDSFGVPNIPTTPSFDRSQRNGQSINYTRRDFGKPGLDQTYSASVQQELATDLIFTLGYLGERGVHLGSNVLYLNDINPAAFSFGTRLGNDPDLESREIRHLQSPRLDALVVASIGENIAQFEEMNKNGEVVVMIDRDFPGLSTNYVGTNNKSAGLIATNHLIDTGCRRIAHIRGLENSTEAGRLQGYKSALSAHGIAYRNDYVVACEKVDTQSVKHGAVAMRALLQCNPIPDGVFCYNDPLAIGAIDAILEAGLRVPEDIAVIGCGNLHYNSCLRVPLSSIDQHSQQIGERAGELVLSLLESKSRPRACSYILEPALVVRSSTRRIEPFSIKAKVLRSATKKRPRQTERPATE